MKELIDQVVAKAGISPEQAQESIATMLEFLKGKLPGPIADQLQNFVEGGNGDGEGGSNPLDAAKDALSGLLGGKD